MPSLLFSVLLAISALYAQETIAGKDGGKYAIVDLLAIVWDKKGKDVGHTQYRPSRGISVHASTEAFYVQDCRSRW